MSYTFTSSGVNALYDLGESDSISGTVTWGSGDTQPAIEGSVWKCDPVTGSWSPYSSWNSISYTTSGSTHTWTRTNFFAPSSNGNYCLVIKAFAGSTVGYGDTYFDVPKDMPPPPPIGPVR